MKMTSLKFAALALVLNVSLYAAEVLKVDANSTVWISSKNEKVQIQDQLCVYQATGLLGCGDVIALTADRFALKLYETKSASRAGEIVTLRKTKRSLATTEKLSGKFEDGSSRSYVDIGLGFNAGLNYYYPSMHLQLAVARSFSLGLEPAYASYSQNGDSVTLLGGYVTATYYYTHFAFKGVNFQGGLGYFNVKATSGTTSQEMSPMAAKLSVGWRGRALIGLPIDFGGALGGQYIFSQNAPLDTSFKGLLPLLNVFVAYCF